MFGEEMMEISFPLKDRLNWADADEKFVSGSSEAAVKIRELINIYARQEEPVLIVGETGVGKNYIARQIHQESGLKGPFVLVDVPSIPDNLFASEMFGHKKGAFTDAYEEKVGMTAIAQGGTLVLDEISEIPSATQCKLLRFIDTKTYRVLGDTREKKADVRIIAATNLDLRTAMEEGKFRRDLYYRLQVLEISVPPLRKRKEDIHDLVMEKKELLKGKSIGKGFWEALYCYDWPGNIRELFNVIKRAGISCTSPICGEQIEIIITSNNTPGFHEDNYNTNVNTNNPTEKLWNLLKTGTSFWEAVKQPFMRRDVKRDEVKKIINLGLKESNGKYKGLLKVFNLCETDYHRFMTFLRDNRLR